MPRHALDVPELRHEGLGCCLSREEADILALPGAALNELNAGAYAIVRTTPPSTRKEVPVVPDACSEQT